MSTFGVAQSSIHVAPPTSAMSSNPATAANNAVTVSLSSPWVALHHNAPGLLPLQRGSGSVDRVCRSRLVSAQPARGSSQRIWLLPSFGLGVALAAKNSGRSRQGRDRRGGRDADDDGGWSEFPRSSGSVEQGSATGMPRSWDLSPSQQRERNEAEAEIAASTARAEAATADEVDEITRHFWHEQKHGATYGPGRKPRVKEPEPLPDPPLSLTPPPELEEPEEETETDTPSAMAKVKKVEEKENDFEKAYGNFKSTIMDIDGKSIEVPEMETYEEAAVQLQFPPFLQQALARRGFYKLTPVQQCTLPLLCRGRDLLASAVTGSGKTAAFLLPTLMSLHQISRIVPGALVAAHFKRRDGSRSDKPILGKVKGFKHGKAAVEFEHATGETHRQLLPADWVVGVPEAPPRGQYQGPAKPLCIVLVPTRELAEQVHNEAEEFLTYSPLRSLALPGTSSVQSQMRDLAHGVDLLVATPGRLVDALHRGVVKLDAVRHLVLDEVDRMMELGFGSQLEEIIEQGGMPTVFSGQRQTSFWSATIPPSVRQLAESFLGRECIWVDCTGGRANSQPGTIEHVLVDARPPHRTCRRFDAGSEVITRKGRRGIAEFPVGNRWRVEFSDGELTEHKMVKKGELYLTSMKTGAIKQDKFEQLGLVLRSREFQKATCVVFCRRRDTVSDVYNFLKEKFLGVVVCHGGMSQWARTKSIQALRDGSAEILVATDIAARGLDIDNITHVVNFELPNIVDEFVHRCGRTGRIGRKGTVVTFVTGREGIFKAVRRVIAAQGRAQGVKLPEWFSLEGMRLPWRPRFYKVPFTKVTNKITFDASTKERFAFMEKKREIETNQKLRFKEKCERLERGKQEDDTLDELDAQEQPSFSTVAA